MKMLDTCTSNIRPSLLLLFLKTT